MTYRPTTADMQQLLSIIDKLGQGVDSRSLRQSIANEMLRLTRADMAEVVTAARRLVDETKTYLLATV